MNKNLNHKILIVGGGIAGPALAIQLHQLGYKVLLIESRDSTVNEEGLFLGLSPNGLKVLTNLVKQSHLLKEYTPGSMSFHNTKGKQIAVLNNDDHKQKYGGMQTIQLKRSTINNLLMQKVKSLGITVHHDTKLSDISQRDNKLQAVTNHLTFDDLDLVIGADGIHSRCRQVIFPEAVRPRYTRQVSTGAIIPNFGLDDSGRIAMTFGKKGFFAYAISNSNDIWWFNNYYLEHEPDYNALNRYLPKMIKNLLLEMHKSDHATISQIISHSRHIFVYPVYEMPPLKKWYTQNICLIGDAAHATAPHIGQGASLALEDTVILTHCLKKYQNPAIAFKRFQDLRKPRVEKLIKQARKIGDAKSKPNAVVTLLRDLFLKHFVNFEKSKMHWVYSYNAYREVV